MNCFSLSYSKSLLVSMILIFTLSTTESKSCYHSGISQVTRVGKRFGVDSHHCNNESENKRLRMTIFSRTGRAWGNGDENLDKEIWIRTKPSLENYDRQYNDYNNDEQNAIDGNFQNDKEQPLAYYEN